MPTVWHTRIYLYAWCTLVFPLLNLWIGVFIEITPWIRHSMNLSHCTVCHQPIDRTQNKRLRKYCSVKCLHKFHSMKVIASGYVQRWQQKHREAKAAIPSDDKKKCAICGLWYRRVAAHVARRHQMNAYQYKQSIGIRTSRGIMTQEDRERMRELALTYNMDERLKVLGKKTRFVLGGEKQKMKKPNAGKKFTEDEYS